MGQEAATILGAAIGTAVVFIGGGWLLFRRVRPWVHIMDDLVGEDARAGRAAQPGLMERMQENERLVLIAAEQATAAKSSAWRTEDLMRRHMENGLAIMEVGIHNDNQLHQALATHGIVVEDVRDYPPVDLAEDLPRRKDDYA